MRAELTRDFELREATLDPETLRIAEELRPSHAPRPR